MQSFVWDTLCSCLAESRSSSSRSSTAGGITYSRSLKGDQRVTLMIRPRRSYSGAGGGDAAGENRRQLSSAAGRVRRLKGRNWFPGSGSKKEKGPLGLFLSGGAKGAAVIRRGPHLIRSDYLCLHVRSEGP